MLAKQNDPDIFKRARCGVCKNRVAERLCDFVIEYRRPAFFKNYEDFTEQELHGTCDFPMCEECSKKYNGIYDFCPHHYALLDEIKPTEEMEKFRNEYYTKEVIGKWK